MPPAPCKRDSMQNNPHSRREREIFPAFLGKVCKKTSQSAPAPDSPEGGAFRHLPVSRAKPPPFGGGGFAKRRRRGFRPLAPGRSFPAVPRFRRKRRCECRFQPRPTCENGIPERPQTLRYSEIINIFSLAYAQSASGGHSKSSSPESGTALNGNCRRSRPCRRGRRESRSCGPPRGRGGCSGRWGQRPACRQDKPPQRCRRRR